MKFRNIESLMVKVSERAVPFLLLVCGQYLIQRFYYPVHAHFIELISELRSERSPLYTVDFVPFWRDEDVGEHVSVVLVVMIT